MRLHPLPSRTHEFQPDERQWPLTRQGAANRTFDHLVGLAAELRCRCDFLDDHPEVDCGAVGFPQGHRPLMTTDHLIRV